MKSNKKIRVNVTRMPEYDNKLWVQVSFLQHTNGLWIPSLEDLCRILRAIAYCEDIKYPPPKHRGRYMLIDFLKAAITNPEAPYKELANEFMVPRINE